MTKNRIWQKTSWQSWKNILWQKKSWNWVQQPPQKHGCSPKCTSKIDVKLAAQFPAFGSEGRHFAADQEQNWDIAISKSIWHYKFHGLGARVPFSLQTYDKIWDIAITKSIWHDKFHGLGARVPFSLQTYDKTNKNLSMATTRATHLLVCKVPPPWPPLIHIYMYIYSYARSPTEVNSDWANIIKNII